VAVFAPRIAQIWNVLNIIYQSLQESQVFSLNSPSHITGIAANTTII